MKTLQTAWGTSLVFHVRRFHEVVEGVYEEKTTNDDPPYDEDNFYVVFDSSQNPSALARFTSLAVVGSLTDAGSSE